MAFVRQILARGFEFHTFEFVVDFLGLGRVLLGQFLHFLGQLLALLGGFFKGAGPAWQGQEQSSGGGDTQQCFHCPTPI
ncbi:hypothetical protein D9M70_635220 [compost metagenome]